MLLNTHFLSNSCFGKCNKTTSQVSFLVSDKIFQPPTQTTSVISNPILINTETTESTPPTEVTEISLPTSFTLKSVINIPLLVSTKTVRNNSDFHKDAN